MRRFQAAFQASIVFFVLSMMILNLNLTIDDRNPVEKALLDSVRQPSTLPMVPVYQRKILTAYLERPLGDFVPGTGSRGNLDDPKDKGAPPQYIQPLPLRTSTPDDLRRVEYPRVQTCHDLPAKFPVDPGPRLDENGKLIVWNVGDDPTPDDFAERELPFCPVEADPFLPWIHDIFTDGTKVHFVAQNKRRCRTGRHFTKDVDRLVPQVTHMQAVSVEEITEERAQVLAPSLWTSPTPAPRYRLAPFSEATTNFTRFICRFHDAAGLVHETLSGNEFNYEMVALRKSRDETYTPKGQDTKLIYNSNIRFHCPIPEIFRGKIQASMDGVPAIYMDLVPIRTSPRYKTMHLTEDLVGPSGWLKFDSEKAWGSAHVLPRVEASGRWANLPVCPPPVPSGLESATPMKKEKPFFLSACVWASTNVLTRGKKGDPQVEALERLEEWIHFHLLVGFDHFFVYDNSHASHPNATTLDSVAKKFPGKITLIDWPSTPCNNNIPAHDSTGERSSQYAAENSCRTRYAPYTHWIGVFGKWEGPANHSSLILISWSIDLDEYLVPMGNFTNLRDMLLRAGEHGSHILSFKSSRGRFRLDKTIPHGTGRKKAPNATFLEAYNCDSAGSPKPGWASRAKKQIYLADYVLYHYVHYSTVTQGHLVPYQSSSDWKMHWGEQPPSERNVNDVDEAVMVHAKFISGSQTRDYLTRCRYDARKKGDGCQVGYPWPMRAEARSGDHDHNGMAYNCFVNEAVDRVWVPRLRRSLELDLEDHK